MCSGGPMAGRGARKSRRRYIIQIYPDKPSSPARLDAYPNHQAIQDLAATQRALTSRSPLCRVVAVVVGEADAGRDAMAEVGGV